MNEHKIGRELSALNNLIRRFLDSNSNKKELEQITGKNGWIIGYIAHHEGDVYQKDLKKEFSITRSTASKVIDLMVQKGFIERQSVSHDARLKKLTLTPKAVAISKEMEEGGMLLEKTLTQGFDEKELEFLVYAIEKMKKNITL